MGLLLQTTVEKHNEEIMKSIHTTAGKKLDLVIDQKTSLYKFQFAPGGELPEELTGVFTAERYAIQALNRYQARKNKNA